MASTEKAIGYVGFRTSSELCLYLLKAHFRASVTVSIILAKKIALCAEIFFDVQTMDASGEPDGPQYKS